MSNITYESETLSAVTYVIGAAEPKLSPIASDFEVKAGKNVSLALATHDEVPFVFAVKNTLLGAARVTQENTVDGSFEKNLHATITGYSLKPEEIEVYMGPCLTFSHTLVERPLIEKLMDMGFRGACKRTDGVDFLDVPMMALIICRRLGIPMINIHIGDYDTFENPALFRSKLRGDAEKNLTVATLR